MPWSGIVVLLDITLNRQHVLMLLMLSGITAIACFAYMIAKLPQSVCDSRKYKTCDKDKERNKQQIPHLGLGP